MAAFDVTVEVKTRAAQWWLLFVAQPLVLLLGPRIAKRVGLWGVHRLVRYRMQLVGREARNGRVFGPWRRFPREMHETMLKDLDDSM